MGKITDYGRVTSLLNSNLFLLDGSNGTKTIQADFLATSLVSLLGSNGLWNTLDSFLSPEQHRMIFRGKNLGSSFTSSQKAQVQNGTFKDIYLGDYWKINDITYRIVDFDYWYGYGSPELKTHHLVIMPDEPLLNATMNNDGTTNEGYYGSSMRGVGGGLASATSTIVTAFGGLSSIISHNEYLVNAVSDGVPSGCTSVSSQIELPSERMIYGSEIMAAKGDYTASYCYSKSQLALFAAAPKFIIARTSSGNRTYYWLRDVVSSASVAYVNSLGYAHYGYASNSFGVRPVFAIG